MFKKIKEFAIICTFILSCCAEQHAQIVINELMADNASTISDSNENTPDWIELFNTSDQTVDLTGWQLSDEAAIPDKWIFPAITIPPRGYLLIFASGMDNFDGVWHTNFKLSKSGETVLLADNSGTVIDWVSFEEQATDQSYGRKVDGEAEFVVFSTSTPGRSNGDGIVLTSFDVSLAFSQAPGWYASAIDLDILANEPNTTLFYTTNGAIPTQNDAIWQSPLHLTANNMPGSQIAHIATAQNWKAPAKKVDTYHTIRVRAFSDGKMSDQILSGTFLLTDGGDFPYTLPVVSILTDADNLFSDKTGIYVKGDADNYHQSGKEWERPAHFAYFSAEGKLQTAQSIGIRIGGATTREEPQKTLKLYARSEYGNSHFNYPFFGNEYDSTFKRLAIRTTMGDKSNRGFTDDFCQQLLADQVSCDLIRRQFVIVLLNGEYWGIHSLREVIDEHYMARKAGVTAEEIDYLVNNGVVKNGQNEDYLDLLAYVQTHDLQEAGHFDRVAEEVDLEKFIDYHIAQFALANDDWPNNNVKFWKTQTGQWRWVVNDLDDTMRESNQSRWRLYFEAHREHHTKWQDLEWAFILMSHLLKNEAFRERFINRFNEFANSTLSPSHSLPLLETFTTVLQPEIKKHIDRWHFPKNENQWEDGIEEARLFLLRRPSFLLSEIFEWFGTPYEWSPNPAKDRIFLKVPATQPQIVRLAIYNSLGQLVFEQPIALSGAAEKIPIDLSIPKNTGVYYFKLDLGRQVFTERILLVF